MTSKPTKTKREERKRTPVGGPKLKLSAQGISPGYRGRWATEKEFEELTAAGYDFITKDKGVLLGDDRSQGRDLGSLMSLQSGSDRVYLMQIKESWYQENQKSARKAIDKTEEHILNPEDGVLFATGGNKINHGRK